MTERRLKALPYVVLAIFALYLAKGLAAPKPTGPFDIAGFGRLPVLSGGRIKPLDTVARTSLLILRGKQTVRYHGRTVSAREWLLEMLFRPEAADRLPVFEIDNPDVLGIMGLQQTPNRYYAFADLHPHLDEIGSQAHQADSVKPDLRTRYQAAIVNLHSRLSLYQKLQNTLQVAGDQDVQQQLKAFSETVAPALAAHMAQGARHSRRTEEALRIAQQYAFLNEMAEFYPIPSVRSFGRAEWISLGQAVLDSISEPSVPAAAVAYATLGDAWRTDDAALFKKTLIEYESGLSIKNAREISRARYEFFFNSFEPFYRCMVIYVAALLIVFLSLLSWRQTLVRTAFLLLVLAFATHTLGLVSRIILQGRPPVTNLYSSAIFVGWAAVLLGIILERFYRNGIGSMVASAIGFVTLIIAHHLASTGDTLEMMRAVLDSNFWLATHVVCITTGYGSTFLSGFLGMLYLIRRALDRRWNDAQAAELERMVYGVVCFSLLFSFVGTILGGIWADQSWGRFWGWDPKENGALMIVLWNACILHARVGKLAGPRAVMMMAVFGNVITAFSWFGVNMLGIGLHSYGFMDKAFIWLLIFAASQAAIIALGLLPDYATRRNAP